MPPPPDCQTLIFDAADVGLFRFRYAFFTLPLPPGCAAAAFAFIAP
jgi:hypothetical protein